MAFSKIFQRYFVEKGSFYIQKTPPPDMHNVLALSQDQRHVQLFLINITLEMGWANGQPLNHWQLPDNCYQDH